MQPTPGDKFRSAMSSREARGSLAIGLVATVVTAAAGIYWFPTTLPRVAGRELEQGIETIVNLTVIAAPVVGVVIGVAGYSILNMRRPSNPPTEDGPGIRTNQTVVMTWTVVSALFCTLAIVWGLAEMGGGEAKALTFGKQAMVVEVTGAQWAWTYKYPAQGITSQELVLPVGQPVLFRVTSVDVNHSFWPVQLGIKVDANKDIVTTAFTIPENIGGLDIHCAELCGLYHAYMANEGQVVMPSDFTAWVEGQKQVTA